MRALSPIGKAPPDRHSVITVNCGICTGMNIEVDKMTCGCEAVFVQDRKLVV